jgi:hypothetical protein
LAVIVSFCWKNIDSWHYWIGYWEKYLELRKIIQNLRKLLNKEFNNFCFITNKVGTIKLRKVRWTDHEACVGEMSNTFNIFVGKPAGKIPLWMGCADCFQQA